MPVQSFLATTTSSLQAAVRALAQGSVRLAGRADRGPSPAAPSTQTVRKNRHLIGSLCLQCKHRMLSFLMACGAVTLALAPTAAHADIWAYVDAQGVTHFAAERLDERYRLFFKGTNFDSQRDGTPRAGSGLKVDGASSAAAGKLAAYFTASSQYKQVRHHVERTAQSTGLDGELLKALIAAESGFAANAVSPKGAVGLMQLMPATAERFGVRADKNRSVADKLTDPATNLQAGARYLQYLIGMFPGRLDLALAAYNAGENAVKRFGQAIPPYQETQNYVRTVLALYEQLQPGATTQPAHRARAATGRAPAATGRVRMELAGEQPAADLTDTPSFLP